MPDAAMEAFVCELGKLVNQLQTMELLLRVFLHNNRAKSEPRADVSAIESAREGELVPENALTNYDTLPQLISKVNAHLDAKKRDLRIDPALVRLRDALAHGRVYANQPSLPFHILKFGRASDGMVPVEINEVVTAEWIVTQRKKVQAAIDDLYSETGAA